MLDAPLTAVPKRTLPNGRRVSLLGLGTVQFGRLAGLRYPTRERLPELAELARLLEHAQELGINLLDTAPAYGASEQRLGALLKGRRDRWLLSSKVGEQLIDGESRFAFDGDSARRSLETSLTRLGTDQLDLVWIHSDGRDLELLQDGDLVPTLLRAREEGLVQLVGISAKTLAGGLLGLELLDLVMCTHNLRVRDQLPVMQGAMRDGRRLLVKKPLDSGRLGDQAEAALGFVAEAPGVASLLLGTLNPVHLSRAAACLAGREGD